jgi:hypothetical protein
LPEGIAKSIAVRSPAKPARFPASRKKAVVYLVNGGFWLWRAVDDEGEVLDLLVQRRRDARAAAKLMLRLLKKQGFAPDVLVTDRLRSYGAAKRELGLSARHEQGLRKHNRAACSSTGAEDATFQIARISAALPSGSRIGPKYLQRPTPSHFPQHAPRSQRRGVSELAGGDRGLNTSQAFRLSFDQSQVPVTTRFGLWTDVKIAIV